MPASSTTHEHVQRMLDEIQRNYNRRLTLGALARTLHRQSAYLGRLFREEIGVTVHEYITRARMEYGSAHIRSGVKIEAVALESGYQSKKNFYRQFRRRFGMTPEAYRREHCQGAVANPAAAEPSRDAHNSTKESALSSRTARPAVGAGRARERDSRQTLLARQIMMRTLAGSRITMLVTDNTGCYVGANTPAVSMTGYSVDELRGMPVGVLFPDVPSSGARCRLQIVLPASSSLPTNTVLHTKSAGPVQVHLTSAENLLEDRQRMPFRSLRGAGSSSRHI